MDFVDKTSHESDNENILAKDPYVATYINILTDEECQHFIDISRDSLKRVPVNKVGS